MNCKKCGNPLHIISGGLKTTALSTKITMVHVWGCINPLCDEQMKEQDRSETAQESFNG